MTVVTQPTSTRPIGKATTIAEGVVDILAVCRFAGKTECSTYHPSRGIYPILLEHLADVEWFQEPPQVPAFPEGTVFRVTGGADYEEWCAAGRSLQERRPAYTCYQGALAHAVYLAEKYPGKQARVEVTIATVVAPPTKVVISIL